MLLKELGGSFVRIGTDNDKSAQLLACIFNATLRDLLGFAQWSTHADDGGLVFLDPGLPRRYALSFLGAALGFRKGVPGRSPRTGLAAEKHGKIGIVRAHQMSFRLRV